MLTPVVLAIALATVKCIEGFNREALAELSVSELLSRKKHLADANEAAAGDFPSPLPLVGPGAAASEEEIHVRGLHRLPARKTLYGEGFEEEEEWHVKKEPKSKFTKLFEVSVTALSFLAFGSYLLCLMAYVVKYKNTDTLAAVGSTVSPQIQFLQQILGPNKSFPKSFSVNSRGSSRISRNSTLFN